jgi:lipoic acid synthetase
MVKQRDRKPPWLKVTGFAGTNYNEVNLLLKKYGLNTVCHAANCPNRGECFNRGTATFLILGPVCSRSCRFCDVQSGNPVAVNPEEPTQVAKAARELGLKHVVVTSVTRDDLPAGGADQFVQTIEKIREYLPSSTIEVLTPDFKSDPSVVDRIIKAKPDVFNHNVETVVRLYPTVRPQADYHGSLELLRYVAENSDIITKSGLMVGLSEKSDELRQTFDDLARAQVQVLTIGQYLAPSANHLPVVRYVTPDEFDLFKEQAEQAGIRQAFSGPLVRSSYLADMVLPPHS